MDGLPRPLKIGVGMKIKKVNDRQKNYYEMLIQIT